MNHYDVAQICVNGHVITSMLNSYPEDSKKFCNHCGAKTINTCQYCGSLIKGHQHIEGVVYFDAYIPPSYCDECGKPYPWTEAALYYATELIKNELSLTQQEQDTYINCLPAVITETPATTLASLKLKKVISDGSKVLAEGLKKFIIEFGCELAKKLIFDNSRS